MRLAIITSGYLPVLDGVTICLRERLKRLSAWGHQVLLIAPDYRTAALHYPQWREHIGEILPNVRVASVPSSRFAGLDWERNPNTAARPVIDRLLAECKPDAIHVDEPERLAAGLFRRAGKAYARRAGIPLIAFYHTNFPDYAPDYIPGVLSPVVPLVQGLGSRVIAAIYNGYDQTLVPAENSYHRLRHSGFRNLRLGDFHGVDTTRFHPNLKRPGYFASEWGLGELDGRFVLLFLGRLTPDKGWALLAKVLPRISAALRDRLGIVIAGDGELREPLQESFARLVPQAHFLGRVHPDRVPALMANASLHVTASEKENFGLTVLEAFASGTPVVGPKAAGIGELVKDGANGCHFSPGDGRTLERLLLDLELDPARVARLGTAARASALGRDWDITIRNWLAAVEALTPQRKANPLEGGFQPGHAGDPLCLESENR
ncbi:MAG TPA: glycosyltransferase [Bryobacteraceae bacterium]|nr:glycosyltransferase [Bryobacteraceae bacterium]